jgi:divalent anion:Na+ symporter, DASS family
MSQRLAQAGTLVLAATLWFWPVPPGLTAPAWHLFALFVAAIVAVVVGALPILTSSILAVAIAVLTRTLTPEQAYAGFSNATILLIIVAFLVARAVVKCGLGARIAHLVVRAFGQSTLGLSYSLFLVDALIAPAFPSNTARSGVLYPIAYLLAHAAGARTGEDSRRRVGGFLMFSGMASLSLSSALWLTAMAANPLGAEMAAAFNVHMDFGSWLIAASVPTLTAMALLPLVLYQVIGPEVTSTPEAPEAARAALAKLGPMNRQEKTVAITFAAMVGLWAVAATLDLDSTAIAFLGLAVLLATGVLTGGDIASEGDVLSTFLWFAALFTLSAQLNELGFMGYVGQKLAGAMGGLPAIPACLVLVVGYVLLHYLFVSQTAHLLALFGVFLDVGVKVASRPCLWRTCSCLPPIFSPSSRRRARARTCSSRAAGFCRRPSCTDSGRSRPRSTCSCTWQ